MADMVVINVSRGRLSRVGGPGSVGPGVRAGGLEVGTQRAPRLIV